MRTAQIREQNDIFRMTEWVSKSTVMLDLRMQELNKQNDGFVDEVIREVRSFDAFSPEYDLRGLHECGVVTYRSMRFMFHICYLTKAGGAIDHPEDQNFSRRALLVKKLE